MPPKKKPAKKGGKEKKPKDKKDKKAEKKEDAGEAGGDAFPLEKGPTPSQMEPTDITRLFKLPAGKLKTEDDVIKSLGYTLEDKLGEGGFGKIFRANFNKKNCKVACKLCELGCDWKDSRVEDMKNELFIMEKVTHLYVVKLYSHFLTQSKENGNRLYIFMELADKGDFSKICKKEGPFSEKEAQGYFAQIACGINHMHSLGIAHRDIKLQNVLCRQAKTASGNLLLLMADFGLSRILHHEDGGELALNRTVCGTPLFMAPEILMKKPYNAFEVDVWALGVTVYIMVTMELPFDFRDMGKVVKDQMAKKWEWKEDNMKEPPSDKLKQLVSGCIEPDVSKRFTMVKLTTHPWIAAAYKAAQGAANKAKVNEPGG